MKILTLIKRDVSGDVRTFLRGYDPLARFASDSVKVVAAIKVVDGCEVVSKRKRVLGGGKIQPLKKLSEWQPREAAGAAGPRGHGGRVSRGKPRPPR